MMPTVYEIESKKQNYSVRIRDVLPEIVKKYKKGGIEIAKEIWELRRGPGRLTPNDYFQYQLYNDEKYSRTEKRRFISDRLVDQVTQKCSDPRWGVITEDKWISYQFLQTAGHKVPDTVAVIDKTMRTFGTTRKISSPDMLREFLSDWNEFPLFGKSNEGLGSFGAFMIMQASSDTLSLANGEHISCDHLFSDVIGDRAYLLQRRVQNHAAIQAFTSSLATIRVMNLVRLSDVLIPFALLKIPASGNIADNYWRPGNLLANIDIRTGKLTRVVRGKGLDLEEVKTHPDNNLTFADFRIPYWEDVLSLSRSCATLLAPLRYHSLDIAVTPDGPLVIEVNYGGAFTLPQIGSGSGLLTDEVSEFFRSCGFKC